MTDTPAHTPLPWGVEEGHIQRGSNGIRYWQITDGQDAIACNQFCYAGNHPAMNAANAAFIVRACNSHYQLVGALGEARRIITEIDDYMMRPERGDWGTECALCMGELLDDDRDALARIDTALSQAGGASE